MSKNRKNLATTKTCRKRGNVFHVFRRIIHLQNSFKVVEKNPIQRSNRFKLREMKKSNQILYLTEESKDKTTQVIKPTNKQALPKEEIMQKWSNKQPSLVSRCNRIQLIYAFQCTTMLKVQSIISLSFREDQFYIELMYFEPLKHSISMLAFSHMTTLPKIFHVLHSTDYFVDKIQLPQEYQTQLIHNTQKNTYAHQTQLECVQYTIYIYAIHTYFYIRIQQYCLQYIGYYKCFRDGEQLLAKGEEKPYKRFKDLYCFLF
eukprot:TRINITY_DN2644_c0_g1_i1.p1 TRINITY_DN2644_c0_g1~~TRINITY_DN2644_c0_g1_i1.p1  ORF type:complete len:260 (+),score=-14.96 TRINITY_DN2644_c0_g1_i1:795-1574(+)